MLDDRPASTRSGSDAANVRRGSGELSSAGARPCVRFERRLAAAPAAVWSALTDREQLRAWFPCDVEVAGDEWAVGAPITFRFPREVIDMTLPGTVTAVQWQRLLEFSWGDETLRFELEPAGEGTRLVFLDCPSASTAARSAAGWEVCLARLAGEAPREDAWRALFDHYVAEFTPVLGPQEGPPEGYRGA